jgi:hypothetical protein
MHVAILEVFGTHIVEVVRSAKQSGDAQQLRISFFFDAEKELIECFDGVFLSCRFSSQAERSALFVGPGNRIGEESLPVGS